MTISKLANEIRSCRKCQSKLQEYGVVPRPIFGGGEGFPIMLIGQAPGKTEYEKNAPFQGDAGKSIKSLFHSCGMTEFDKKVYQTSVTKCFPGRLPGASTDRFPSVPEVSNCTPFLEMQLALLQPKLIVCLGALSWRAYARLREKDEPGYCAREFPMKKVNDLRVPDLVGKRFAWKGMVILPMIHPAKSANGSRSKYPGNDELSKQHLRKELLHLLP